MTADAVGGVWPYALDLAARPRRPRASRSTLAVLGPCARSAQRAAAAAVPGLDLVDTGLPLDWTAERRGRDRRTPSRSPRRAGARRRRRHRPAQQPGTRWRTRAFRRRSSACCHSCVATWWAAVRGGAAAARTSTGAPPGTRAGYRAADGCWSRRAAPSPRRPPSVYGIRRRADPVHNGRAIRGARRASRPQRARLVFTAGRLWDEGKNVAALDRAAARLSTFRSGGRAARGPERRHDRAAAYRSRSASLTARDVERMLARRRSSSRRARYEPFGLAVLEAAQAGCALVLSDIPTFRELWDGAAMFVPPR